MSDQIFPLRLASGAAGTFRPLAPTDGPALGRYFLGLSDETRRRFGPHPLDQATADRLCAAIDPRDTLRMVACLPAGAGEEIVAYIILRLGVTDSERSRYAGYGIALDPAGDCTVAPSVADALQGQGLGSLLMPLLLAVARQIGRRRAVLLGGTQATNQRAVHFYRKHGFREAGAFEHPPGAWNYDMVAEL